MRYVNRLRRLISNAAEWFHQAAAHRDEDIRPIPDDQASSHADYRDDVFYISFLGPHV
jgi:hypothetical protein